MIKAITAAVVFLGVTIAFASQEPPPDDFPIAELQYRNGSQLFYLHSAYGFVARWDGNGKTSFFLYDKARTNISTTTDLKTFLDELIKFPEGSEVAWVNTCGAPLHYGMPTEMLSKIENVLKKRRLKMAGIEENNFVLCTCEATNFLFFTKLPTKPEESANKTGQRTEANRSAQETNRTSSADGSTR